MGLGLVSCLHYSYTSISRQIGETNHLCLTGLNKTNDISVHSFKCSYMEENGHVAPNNGRSSHNVGRLGNLIRVALESLTLLLWFFFLYIYGVLQYLLLTSRHLSLQDNDEFFELISSKFLTERRYSVSVKAAAARLLFSCSLTWMVEFYSWLFYL